MRTFIARALALLLLALALAAVWNGIHEFQWAKGISYAVPILQLIAAPFAALGGHWLWRRDRRALSAITIALILATAAGAFAAWSYTPESDRMQSMLAALGAGAVFTAAVTLLAYLALRRPIVNDST